MDDHVKQLLLLGREHYHKREFDKAEFLLRQVLEHTDRFADVHDMLGVIAHSRGDFVRAEGYFEKAVELNPKYTEAQLNLMVTYNDLGKYEAARRVYARIRHLGGGEQPEPDPFAKGKIANMHAQTSQAYLDAGLLKDAIVELAKAVALCPTFVDLRTRLATLYRDNGDIDKAREQLSEAIATNPKYLQARVQLGLLLISEGNEIGAMVEFKEVLEQDPDNKRAQSYVKILEAQWARSDPPPSTSE